MTRRAARGAFGACALGVLALVAAACSEPGPSWAELAGGVPGEPTVRGEPLRVPRAARPPRLDGKLDEAIWQQAARLGPFVDPGDGSRAASPVEAAARVTWDDARLWLGVVVRDVAPTSPFGRDDADPHVWERSSAVELMLAPGDHRDNRDYYELQVDVAGAVFDTRWGDYNFPIRDLPTGRLYGDQHWSSRLERAVHVVDGRFWSVEIGLPWSALLPGRTPIPPRRGDVWRMNLYSFRDGQAEARAWSPIRGAGNFHRTSRFGRVRFE